MAEYTSDNAGDLKSFFIRFAIQHGPWAVLSIVLLAATFGWLKTPHNERIEYLENIILQNRVVIMENRAAMQQIRAEIQNSVGYQNVLLRAICRNQVTLQQQGICEPKYYGYEEKITK